MHPIPRADYNSIVHSLLTTTHSLTLISEKSGHSLSTVSRIAKEVAPHRARARGGRPQKLTSHDRRSVVTSIATGRAANAVQAAQRINRTISSSICTQTVRNILKEEGFTAVVKKKKPMLKTQHRKERLEFAKKYGEWTVEDWKRVIWSDETKINRFGSDGRQYVWKKKGQPLGDKEVKGTVKFGGGNIMVWGCMGWNGVGRLVEVEGRMDAKQYVEILKDGLLPSIQESGILKEQAIFQQDNDPKHTSQLAQNWLRDEGIRVLDWPSQSPDINPLEHLWMHLKRQLSRYEKAPKGVWELWERAAKVWEGIDAEVCQRLIESIPNRLAEVVKARGGNTKY